ncbi:hypothetical protein ALGA_0241 [Labilibaculum antarcticum]|uniref:EpsG family protein n=2 Tax=Labilibaculum antarcticum TaxID=1717717 RepID=A0A1Y1CE63_9BACT|nr:hypothetical protein ALGA_0241 [Labilibaculum antarcticum]
MVISSHISVSIARSSVYDDKLLGKGFYYLPILIYSLFWGLRYNVGTDFQSYENFFRSVKMNTSNIYKLEPGYHFLNEILANLDLTSTSIFIVTSFIVVYFLYKSVSTKSNLLPIVIFFYFTTSTVLFSQNGIRQSIALCILFIVIRFFVEKKYIKSIILLILAFLFHKSVLIPAMLIPIFYRNIFSSRILVLIAMLFTLIFGTELLPYLLKQSAFIFTALNYDQLDRILKFSVTFEKGSGIGFLLKISIYILTIYLSPYVKNYFKLSPYIIFYNFFILGIILEPIISQNYFLNRINMYFLPMRIFVYAYSCLYLMKNNTTKNYLFALYYFIAHILFFIASVYSNSNDCGYFQFR